MYRTFWWAWKFFNVEVEWKWSHLAMFTATNILLCIISNVDHCVHYFIKTQWKIYPPLFLRLLVISIGVWDSQGYVFLIKIFLQFLFEIFPDLTGILVAWSHRRVHYQGPTFCHLPSFCSWNLSWIRNLQSDPLCEAKWLKIFNRRLIRVEWGVH